MPTPPAPPHLPPDDKHTKLNEKVREALEALPGYFRSETVIEGINATDLFALNSSLGGTIEIQVVETLNTIRKVWDPHDEWQEYRFERRSQSFPDVRLVAGTGLNVRTALGVELKGWYLLAKEGEPSFRYTVTPEACDPFCLLVIVPWHLKNVLSGSPVTQVPYVESARYAAEARNYWWQHVRSTGDDRTIKAPPDVVPYRTSRADVN